MRCGPLCCAFRVTDMLINCAAYQDGRKLADIDIDSISG
ncbi:magnesium transporter, partial [bacterium M00.F.Ca.ET.199.01.1.1]